MCLACGSVGDPLVYNALVSWLVMLSPLMGLFFAKTYRLMGVRPLLLSGNYYYWKLGGVLAGYNLGIYLCGAAVSMLVIDIMHIWVAITWVVLAGLLLLWWRFTRKIIKLQPKLTIGSSAVIAALGATPWFITFSIFAAYIAQKVPRSLEPYMYKANLVFFAYDYGMLFSLCLMMLSFSVVFLRLYLYTVRYKNSAVTK